MSSSKTIDRGLCGRCLSEFIDWRYIQSSWYFRPSFVNCCPSNVLCGSTLTPLPPLLCVNKYTVFTYTVWWYGVLLETIFCRSLTLCTWPTRFRTYKIVTLPQTKILEGRGPQTDKHLPQSPFTCYCFVFWYLYSLLVNGQGGGGRGGGGGWQELPQRRRKFLLLGEVGVEGVLRKSMTWHLKSLWPEIVFWPNQSLVKWKERILKICTCMFIWHTTCQNRPKFSSYSTLGEYTTRVYALLLLRRMHFFHKSQAKCKNFKMAFKGPFIMFHLKICICIRKGVQRK